LNVQFEREAAATASREMPSYFINVQKGDAYFRPCAFTHPVIASAAKQSIVIEPIALEMDGLAAVTMTVLNGRSPSRITFIVCFWSIMKGRRF
jgi:hypothetical protein